MIQLWIGLAVGTIMLAVIALLVWRERGLRRQLAEYRDLLSRAAEGRLGGGLVLSHSGWNGPFNSQAGQMERR
ncbi:hypothetical protein [Pseudomonas syringae]|uniref:hypothetical protein n=1 Tax=Pseudomonas syringae TaxID=317 RepID=UPI001F454CC9|nr:hypothetical protein [Pseudomonas syringae]